MTELPHQHLSPGPKDVGEPAQQCLQPCLPVEVQSWLWGCPPVEVHYGQFPALAHRLPPLAAQE